MNSLRARILLICALTIVAIYSVSPTIVYFSLPKEIRNDQAELQKRLPDWLPKKHISLGLDIQGGVQLVLGVDTSVAVDNKMGRIGTELTRWANEVKPQVKNSYAVKDEQKLRVELEAGVDVGNFQAALQEKFFGLKVVNRQGNRIDFVYDDYQMKTIRDAALGQAERVVRKRIDKWGVSEPSITRRKDGSIMVQLPGFKDPEKARELLGRTAQLQFKMVDEEFDGFQSLLKQVPEEIKAEKRGNYKAVSFISENREAIEEFLKDKIPEGRELGFEEEQVAGGKKTVYTSHLLFASTQLSGEDILDAFVVTDESSMDNWPAVSLRFTGSGGKVFGDVTGANVNKRMAIVLDEVVVSDPVINQRISGGSAQITLGRGQGYAQVVEDANELALILKSGALPAPITVMEERQVGATLGPELANQGVMAVIIGLILVLAYMAAYYRIPGLISCVALTLNGVFLLSLMAAFGFSLSLPGFAGFILTLGMGVDANVLINERIRQELREGKNAKKAVENGFGKVFWTIVDANATTLLAGLVLLETNPSGPIRGFAVALVIGLLVSVFTALFCSKVMFQALTTRNRPEKQISGWIGAKAAAAARVFKFDFLAHGRIVTIGAAVLALAIIVTGVTRGVNWSVDFAGGTEMEIYFEKPVAVEKVRGALARSGVGTATLQSVGDKAESRYLVRFEKEDRTPKADVEVVSTDVVEATEDLSATARGVRETLLSELAQYVPDLQRVDFVGPAIGKELRNQGIMSLFWAMLLIIGYIGLRFDMRFAPGAVIKMLHDVIIVMGFYIFFNRSFDLTTIAALLTVIGYSVNDTIVIYDRIRENLALHARRSFWDNVNASLNETLTRSLNTSISTIIALIGLIIFGQGGIWNFAMAMAIGVIAATFSSTFIGTYVLIWAEDFKRARIARLKPS